MLSVVLGAVMNIVLDPVFIYRAGHGRDGRGRGHGDLAGRPAAPTCCAFLFGRRRARCRIDLSAAMSSRVDAQGTAHGLHAVCHHRRGQRDDHRHERHPAALWRRGARATCCITCATIVQSFMLVVTMPLGGISGGTQTILSFNYGARQVGPRARARRGASLRWCAGVSRPSCSAWPGVAGRAVRAPVHHGRAAWRTRPSGPFACAAWRCCRWAFSMQIVDGFTALGQVRYSLPLSFWRKLVYFVALFALPAAFGARAAFFAEPVSDVLGPAVSIAVYLLVHPPHSAAAGERPAGRMSRYSQEGRRRSSRRTLDQSNSAVSSSRSAARSSSSRPAACASMPSSRCGRERRDSALRSRSRSRLASRRPCASASRGM